MALGFPLSFGEFSSHISKFRARTCYILGSGGSVSELSESHYRAISEGFSIGINSWVSHPFEANAYSFEADGYANGPRAEIDAMTEDLKIKFRLNPNLNLFLLRPKRADLSHRMVDVPEPLRRSSLMYGRQNLLTTHKNNLDLDLHDAISYATRTFGRIRVVIDNGASVVRLVFLCYLLGFRRIVLVGVDLNSSPYFWNQTSEFGGIGRLREHYPRLQGGPHATTQAVGRPFSTTDFLISMASQLRRSGVQIFAASPSSALASHLGIYQWSSLNE